MRRDTLCHMSIQIGGLARTAAPLASPPAGVTVDTDDPKWTTVTGDASALEGFARSICEAHLESESGDEPCRRAARAIYRGLDMHPPWAMIASTFSQ